MGKKSRLAATKSDGKEPNNLDAENQIHIGLPEITRTLSQIRKQQIQYAQQKIQFPERSWVRMLSLPLVARSIPINYWLQR